MPISFSSVLLFAQADAVVRSSQAIPVWAVISALALAGISLLVLVPTVLGLRFARRQRDLEHAERMRALELGHPLPGAEPPSNPSQSPGMLIGLWVPISVFGIAFVASQSGHQQHEAWIAAAIVGTAAVICGTILAMRPSPANVPPPGPRGKPMVDPAAYEDLAERR